MPPLHVVCLISGGKDSLFSILHCLQHGHHVVALANLHPPHHEQQDGAEDLDSFMYQTVGHKVIPLYEEALGLPLYRQEIIGSAVNQSKSYGQTAAEPSTHQDETESLVPLLQRVKEQHPEVNAVSTGAILSDYQRTRVESVAIRLGLTPLAYLWQWPNMPPHTQSTLLEDMHAAGQDFRIIKVASGGLDGSFLWCNVADLRIIARLGKAIGRFGSGDDGAVLGEGGEYETLAVSGPAPLWKGKIGVEDGKVESVAGEAGSASVKIFGAQVIENGNDSAVEGVRIPPLLEPQFETLLRNVTAAEPTQAAPLGRAATSATTLHDHVCYQHLWGPVGKPATEQMAAIMDKAKWSTLLSQQKPPLEFAGIAYISIVLRNMTDFAAVNAGYSASFTEPNPPARITLAEPSVLQEGMDVMVSLTCVRGSTEQRHGLHVQSQSYWAPANIGPYSQAVSVPTSSAADEAAQRIVYIAGQIPLIPASMALDSPKAAEGDLDGFIRQAALAAQHFIRIGRAMHVKAWARGIAFITAVTPDDAEKKANLTRRVWEALHRSGEDASDPEEEVDDEGFDVWNVRHGTQRSFQMQDSGQHHLRQTGGTEQDIPHLEVIQVEALPRGASIEWAVYGLTANEDTVPRIPHYEHLLEVFKQRVVRSG